MKKWKKITALTLAALMACALVACGKKDQGTIKIASKPMTEQYILSEILKQLIEHDLDVKVEVTKGVGGGTTNIHPALLKGDFDLYPEYTGTGWISVLKHEKENDSVLLYENLKTEYDALGLHWTGLYGFQNSYVLAARKAVADQYNLKTFSDLAVVSGELVFGGNPDYMEREDGFPLLTSAYQMSFKSTMDVDIALKYAAMADAQIDVTNAFTTDAMLSTADVTLLEDDQNFFATYYGATVVRNDTLKKYPELEATLEKLTGIISDEDMRKMNYAVEVDKKDEVIVAKEFLAGKGLLN